MKISKLIVSILVPVVVILLVLLFIFTPIGQKIKTDVLSERSSAAAEKKQMQEKPKDSQPVTDTNKPEVVEPNKPETPADVNKPAEPNEPNEPTDPNKIMEALNLKNVEMKDIIQKLSEWTDKVIIPDDEAMKVKITIYSPDKLPRYQALALIYSALRAKGFVAEYTDNAIYLKPIATAKFGAVPTVPADYPLAAIENKYQVVQKFFTLKNYSPTQMNNIIVPLVGEHGYVSADEAANTLLVIDTVESLMRIERIINQFDVPGIEQTETEVFEIRDGDPGEIVQLLRLLLGDTKKAKPGGPANPNPPAPSPGANQKSATSVLIGSSDVPVVLIAEQKRKWIIAKGSPEDIEQISEWVSKLDVKEKVETEYETIPIKYADVREVADRLNQSIPQMPGTELKTSVLIQPLVQARQIMIFGRADIREMVKKLIQEIDIPPGQFEQKTFTLKHADPEEIKENIEELFEDINADVPYWRRQWQQSWSPDTVRVIAFSTLQQITVTASSDNMLKIEEQIKKWDVPIDVEKVKPLIITLQNSDPVKMAELLSKLFTEQASTRQMPWWWYWEGGSDEKKKIVGALYGQLTFEAVPETKKIIVISKIPEAYSVIQELVAELDRQEMAEVPKVVILKYADPEELAMRLNAIFNEPGTVAEIHLGEKQLSQYGMEEDKDENTNKQNQEKERINVYSGWWGKAQRRTDEMPISNVIGRIRFIPEPRSKAILVLAPPEFMPTVEQMIEELDVPGKQVIIRAVVLEVKHDDLTSLGVQLASDPASFGTLEENVVTALTGLGYLEETGAKTVSVDIQPTALQFTASLNVTALIDFLVKKIDAKILNQQTLWTKDNEEADFFKGEKVAFITNVQFSQAGGRDLQEFEYEKVGMTLRIRPNITPQNKVSMEIDLTMSQVTSDVVNTQPVRSLMNTTSYALAGDGETVMLGGIIFQESSLVQRKLPLLGDAPLVGGLFRHERTVEANNELLVFIVPYVIDEDPNNMLPETIEQLERGNQRLQDTLSQLRDTNEDQENAENNQVDIDQ